MNTMKSKLAVISLLLMFFQNGFCQMPVIQWQHSFGGTSVDYTAPIRQTSDGGFILAGATYSNDGDVNGNHSSDQDLWVLKIDSGGSIQWQKCLGGTAYEDLAYPTPTANTIQ